MRRALTLLLAFVLAACAAPVNTPPPQVETGVDPEAWASIPAGEFRMGLHAQKAVIEYDYEMMVTTVTNAQYARYLNEALAAGAVTVVDAQVLGFYPGDVYHGHKHEERIDAGDYLHVPLEDPSTHVTFDGKAFAPVAGYDSHPMVMVTWFGAQAYCEFYGWRLPTDPEWEKAARGADDRAYPWGEAVARHQANFYTSRDPFEPLAAFGADTTPVGFFNGRSYDGYATLSNASPYGLYDMGGNVWQWTGSIYEGAHYRSLRGGSKDTYEYNLRVFTVNNATPKYYSPAVGFRCAR